MAPNIAWKEVVVLVPIAFVDALLEEGKHNAAGKSQSVNCTMCASVLPHPMQYKLLACRSELCIAAYPGVKCTWKSKFTTCRKLNETSIYESGYQLSQASDPPNRSMRESYKQYCRLMATEGLKPLRIRNGLRMKFEIPSDELPKLSTVQRFVNNYRKTKLGNHDCIQDIDAMVRAKVNHTVESDDNAPITFTWPPDENGNAFVGKGTDVNAFMVGVTTKNLLRTLDRPSTSFVLHVDATYKLSQVGYPVLVIGISDRCRTFHLVAFCIVTELVLTAALASLNRLYASIMCQTIQLTHIMGDADDAQYNALQSVFASKSSINFFDVFFHVLLNVNKKLQAVPNETAASIRSDIYNMHFSSTKEEFLQLATAAIKRWMKLQGAQGFAGYFSKEWFGKRFLMWQCFWMPPGYATTNNPVEQFNRHIKQHYSLHLKLKTGSLLLLLFQCVASESAGARPFRDSPEPASTLATRMRELTRDNLLTENDQIDYSGSGTLRVQPKGCTFLLNGAQENIWP